MAAGNACAFVSCLFGIGFLTRSAYCSLILFALTLSGLYLEAADVFLVGLVCVFTASLCKIEAIDGLWPLPIVTALVLVLIIGKLFKLQEGNLIG